VATNGNARISDECKVELSTAKLRNEYSTDELNELLRLVLKVAKYNKTAI